MKKLFYYSVSFIPSTKEWSTDMLEELEEVIGKPKVYAITERNGKETISRINLTMKEVDGEVVEGHFFRNYDLDAISEIVGTGRMVMRIKDQRRDPDAKMRFLRYVVEDGYAYPMQQIKERRIL